jgi:hypothetical protein
MIEELERLITQYGKFHFELTYSSITDWMIHIYRRGYNNDNSNKEIFEEQNVDLMYLIAKATVFMKDYLTENNGGY